MKALYNVEITYTDENGNKVINESESGVHYAITKNIVENRCREKEPKLKDGVYTYRMNASKTENGNESYVDSDEADFTIANGKVIDISY